MKKRERELSDAMAKIKTFDFTDEETAIMDRFKLNPEMKAWVIMPIYEAGGRIDISKKEMAIIRALVAKLDIDLVVLEKYGGEA